MTVPDERLASMWKELTEAMRLTKKSLNGLEGIALLHGGDLRMLLEITERGLVLALDRLADEITSLEGDE